MLTLSSLASGPADARRGGSFGSRGSRTYSSPSAGYGAQRTVPPIERSMTPRAPASGQPGPGYTQGYDQRQPYRQGGSRFGGFGGGLVGGLIAGGLLGHFLGGGMSGGWGSSGGGGMLATLIQLAVLAGIVWLVVGFFRRRTAGSSSQMAREAYVPTPPVGGAGPWGGAATATYDDRGTDISVTPRDQEAFERLLVDVQDAFGREDYARLRELTTPEIMSYLAEELSQNATRGVRNEVRETRLLDAEVSEAWREANADYATIILRYEGIDLLRDRATGAIVSGSATIRSETTELWTFVRSGGGPWQLSAIQES